MANCPVKQARQQTERATNNLLRDMSDARARDAAERTAEARRDRLKDAQRYDQMKVQRAEEQLKREDRNYRIMENVLAPPQSPQQIHSKMTSDIADEATDRLGLNSKKQLERKIDTQYNARRTGQIIVEQEKAGATRRAAPVRKTTPAPKPKSTQIR